LQSETKVIKQNPKISVNNSQGNANFMHFFTLKTLRVPGNILIKMSAFARSTGRVTCCHRQVVVTRLQSQVGHPFHRSIIHRPSDVFMMSPN